MRKKHSTASVRFAVAAMERATEGMPSETRDRYHDELVAEMYGLSAPRRWRYAVGVAASASAMKGALAPGAPTPPPRPQRRLGCRTNTHHVWMTTHADDGALYRACARCGKEYIPTGTAGVIGG